MKMSWTEAWRTVTHKASFRKKLKSRHHKSNRRNTRLMIKAGREEGFPIDYRTGHQDEFAIC